MIFFDLLYDFIYNLVVSRTYYCIVAVRSKKDKNFENQETFKKSR